MANGIRPSDPDHALTFTAAALSTPSVALEPESRDGVDLESVTLAPAAHLASKRKASPEAPPGPATEAAQQAQAVQADQQGAEEIFMAMAAERHASQERIRAIVADMQTTILEIWQEVALRRQKAAEKAMEAWSKVEFGETH